MTKYTPRLSVQLVIFILIVLLSAISLPSQGAQTGDIIIIRQDAPEEYVVVRGDTLWDISGRFLEKPWLWPQIWGLNPQIEDPHWIYPGDIIGLIYIDGVPRLTLNRDGKSAGLDLIKLSPMVRREAIRSAIPAISLEDINAFLSGNSIVGIETLANAPYLLEGRAAGIYASDDDIIFARGDWTTAVSSYDVVRPGRNYSDPRTGKVIGAEAILIGTASLLSQEGDQAVLVVDKTLREVREGDLFIPREARTVDSMYFPQPPNFEVNASVIGIQSGNTIGGNFDSLVLNVGKEDQISVGHLLLVQKQDYEITDRNVERLAGKSSKLIFPGEKFAKILVYRVFENSSLALVLNTEDVIKIDDRVITPQ